MELKTVFERVHVEDEIGPTRLEHNEESIASQEVNVGVDQLANTDPVPVVEPASAWLSRRAVALAALVLALATLAVVLWPGNLEAILDRNRTAQIIGVPDASPASVVQDNLNAAVVSSEPAPAPTKDAASGNQIPPAAPVIAENVKSDSLSATAGANRSHELPPPAEAPDNSSAAATQEVAKENMDSGPGVPSKAKTVTSATKRRPYGAVRQRPFDDNALTYLPPPHRRFRTRAVGNTPDGYLILRLPSGETAIVPPAGFPRRRVFFERRRILFPPPPFAPPYPLGD
jgi:hypothetical protein